MGFCSNCGAALDAEATLCSKCGKKVGNKTFSSEPMSEDDCPESFPVASAQGRGINGENIAFNYIKEKEEGDYRPLNVQHPYRGEEN
jgi:hypothetical protein